MVSFGSVNTTTSNNYRANWQKHHVVPTQQYGLEELERLFAAISDPALPEGVGYAHETFDFNGILLPEAIRASLAFGFAQHFGSHTAFSAFVQKILLEIQTGLDDGRISVEEAARSVRGFQAYLIDKLTVDRYDNDLTGDSIARAEFYLNSATPWLITTDNNEIFNFTIEDIRSTGQNAAFWRGYYRGCIPFA